MVVVDEEEVGTPLLCDGSKSSNKTQVDGRLRSLKRGNGSRVPRW